MISYELPIVSTESCVKLTILGAVSLPRRTLVARAGIVTAANLMHDPRARIDSSSTGLRV